MSEKRRIINKKNTYKDIEILEEKPEKHETSLTEKNTICLLIAFVIAIIFVVIAYFVLRSILS